MPDATKTKGTIFRRPVTRKRKCCQSFGLTRVKKRTDTISYRTPMHDSIRRQHRRAARKKALDRYNTQVCWYERRRRTRESTSICSRRSSIICSGITPVLILATDWKIVQAIFPAIAGILAGLLGIYNFKMRGVVALSRLRLSRVNL